jgi:hypothetical protein
MKPSPFDFVTVYTDYTVNTYDTNTKGELKTLLWALGLKAKRMIKAAEAAKQGDHKINTLLVDLRKVPKEFLRKKEVANGSGATSTSGGSSSKAGERESFTWGSGYR